jgi:RHH-type proline utilization regulon transcriptional repressor/proline dehydrogenase/delta 1-pyrroline-5-carboxylate dehydrogenase
VKHSSDIEEEAIDLATKWKHRADALQNSREKSRYRKLARLFTNPKDKIILTKLIDQSFRTSDYRRVADQIYHLLTAYGTPDFFSPVEKFLMQFFIYAGRFLPALTVPVIIEKMRYDSSHLIISGERKALQAFLQKRKNQGIRININHIGEVVLGEEDAASRLKIYLEDLQNPLIEFLSVKISTILSQILAGFERLLQLTIHSINSNKCSRLFFRHPSLVHGIEYSFQISWVLKPIFPNPFPKTYMHCWMFL